MKRKNFAKENGLSKTKFFQRVNFRNDIGKFNYFGVENMKYKTM